MNKTQVAKVDLDLYRCPKCKKPLTIKPDKWNVFREYLLCPECGYSKPYHY